jgi:hypothetical protein
MAMVRCPSCQRALTLPEWCSGEAVCCPICANTFTATKARPSGSLVQTAPSTTPSRPLPPCLPFCPPGARERQLDPEERAAAATWLRVTAIYGAALSFLLTIWAGLHASREEWGTLFAVAVVSFAIGFSIIAQRVQRGASFKFLAATEALCLCLGGLALFLTAVAASAWEQQPMLLDTNNLEAPARTLLLVGLALLLGRTYLKVRAVAPNAVAEAPSQRQDSQQED